MPPCINETFIGTKNVGIISKVKEVKLLAKIAIKSFIYKIRSIRWIEEGPKLNPVANDNVTRWLLAIKLSVMLLQCMPLKDAKNNVTLPDENNQFQSIMTQTQSLNKKVLQ